MNAQKRLVLCTSLVCTALISTLSFAETHSHNHNESGPGPLEHVELTLPKGLLSGFPILNRSVSLQEAITLGLQNNVQIGVAQAETNIQRSLLLRAQARRWPIFSVGALTFIRGGNSQTLMTPDMMMNTVNATVFQDLNATAKLPLFTGGAIVTGIKASRSAVTAAEAETQQATVEMAYQIREAYLKAQLSEAEHHVHQQHITVQQELLKNAEHRFQVGRGLKADILRIKTELADAQRMLNEEHKGLNDQLLDLKAAMGLDLGSEITIRDSLTYVPWAGAPLPELIHSALERHPQILNLHATIREAEAQVRIARAALLPQVYGQVTGNLRFPTQSPMMGNGVIGMLNASMPVLDKNKLAAITEANAKLKKAQQQLKEQQLLIAKQVAKAWNELLFTKENIALAEAAITQAEEDFRLIQRRVDVGRSIQVEVQDAALKWRDAELNQLDAYYNYELSKAKLLRASGKVF